MEDVPGVCSGDHDGGTALVRADETPKRRTKETRAPLPARQDFAGALKDLADVHFPGKRIILVTDNLNTHKLSTLYDTFGPAEASRLAGRFGARRTPKRGSRLNMAGTGINVLSRQRLDRRIPDRETMVSEAAAWQEHRNRLNKGVAGFG